MSRLKYYLCEAHKHALDYFKRRERHRVPETGAILPFPIIRMKYDKVYFDTRMF